MLRPNIAFHDVMHDVMLVQEKYVVGCENVENGYIFRFRSNSGYLPPVLCPIA